MTVKLVLSEERVECLKKHLGQDSITYLGEPDSDGYIYVSFEVNHDMDVLSVLHAGVDSGLALGLYGSARKPKAA